MWLNFDCDDYPFAVKIAAGKINAVTGDTWDKSRCFVHLCNSVVWREITGGLPPQPPLTAAEYQQQRIPWFDYYTEDLRALPGSERLGAVKSVGEFSKLRGDAPLPGGGPIKAKKVVSVGPAQRPDQVREWSR